MTANITRHGAARTKERIGISKKIAQKNAQKALDFGVTHEETSGPLRRYLDYLYFNGGIDNARIYHRYIYLFAGTTLITIFYLPKKYQAVADKLQKRRESMPCFPA